METLPGVGTPFLGRTKSSFVNLPADLGRALPLPGPLPLGGGGEDGVGVGPCRSAPVASSGCNLLPFQWMHSEARSPLGFQTVGSGAGPGAASLLDTSLPLKCGPQGLSPALQAWRARMNGGGWMGLCGGSGGGRFGRVFGETAVSDAFAPSHGQNLKGLSRTSSIFLFELA